jgi:hypothetical protein
MKEASINLVTSDIDAKDKVDSAKLSVQVFDPNNKVDQSFNDAKHSNPPMVYFYLEDGTKITDPTNTIFKVQGGVVQGTFTGSVEWQKYVPNAEQYKLVSFNRASGASYVIPEFENGYDILMIFEKVDSTNVQAKLPVKYYFDFEDNNLVPVTGNEFDGFVEGDDINSTDPNASRNEQTLIDGLKTKINDAKQLILDNFNKIQIGDNVLVNGKTVQSGMFYSYDVTNGSLNIQIPVLNGKTAEQQQVEWRNSGKYIPVNVTVQDAVGHQELFYSNMPVALKELQSLFDFDSKTEGIALVADGIAKGMNSKLVDVSFLGLNFRQFSAMYQYISGGSDVLSQPIDIFITVDSLVR